MSDFPLPQALPQLRGLGETQRQDRWWVNPLLVFLGLSAFIVYSTWAALQAKNFFVPGTHYLSPMYSPVLWDIPGQHSGHAWFGEAPKWLLAVWPGFVPFSPAFFILWAPAGFRFTCYYYRGAYYKAFWGDPFNCAVGEPGFRKKNYRGEEKLPLIFQNIHRYFFYIAAIFIGLLSYDAIMSFFFTVPVEATLLKGVGNPIGTLSVNQTRFGIGVGSLVLTINPILLGGYTFGCHVYRHLVGGRHDELSKLGGRKKMYDCVSCLNRSHMKWAWASLVWVGFTDFYVRMVAAGTWHDYRIIF